MASSSTASLPLSSAIHTSRLVKKSYPDIKTTTITLKSPSFPPPLIAVNVITCTTTTRARRVISCQAVSSASLDKDEKDASVSGSTEAEEEAKVGAKVKVKVPVKVYHVSRVAAELDLNGFEGVIKQYAGVWKGKRISANLPYKVEFVKEVEGRGPVKFFAHLKEEELEFLD